MDHRGNPDNLVNRENLENKDHLEILVLSLVQQVHLDREDRMEMM